MLGALIIRDQAGAVEDQQHPARPGSSARPWATVEILGKTVIARLVEEFRRNGCDLISLIAGEIADDNPAPSSRAESVDLASECLAGFRRKGCENLAIVRCGAYVEIDLPEMLGFHQEQGIGVTRAVAESGPLDVWIVDASWPAEHASLLSALACATPALYPSRGYVNDLQTPRDFRRLALDGLYSHCHLSPQGSEIRPGFWVCEGAQIERTARVVAPAFIGRNVLISGECLITRGSNVESDSHVDFGTAVEDSSILSNSYVGIGLDLTHSIVDGINLLNLRHNVSLVISDPVVLRKNAVRRRTRQVWSDIESGEMVLTSAE